MAEERTPSTARDRAGDAAGDADAPHIPTLGYEDAAARRAVPFMAECRHAAPVVRLTSPEPTRNGYMITRYADVQNVCRDPATYSSIGNPQSDRWGGELSAAAQAIYRQEGWPLVRALVWADPPGHTRYRKLVDKIFMPARVAARAEHISLCIDKLMARFPADGLIDGVGDFAMALPAMVMTREFAASEDDFQFLIDTTNAIGRSIEFTQTDPAEAEDHVTAAAHATVAFQHYMLPRIEAVRRQPSNTMLSELVNAVDDSGTPILDIQEVQTILINFLIAATHSTTGGIAWALHALCEHQEVQARLRREPDKIDAFVDEVMRMHGTVATSFRTATCPAAVDGTPIPTGAQVYLRWDSANYDEAKWQDPERFDLDRKGLRNHMAFGYGLHFCVGSTLARKELALSAAAFLDRYEHIAFAGTPRRLDSFGLNALTSLPMQLSA